jgi:hypothetical protein
MTHENTATARDDRSPAHVASGVTVSRRGIMNMLVKSSAVVAATALPALAAAVPIKSETATPPIAPGATDPDAALIALGEQLKAASAEAARLEPRRLYDECWNASGFDKSPKGRANVAARRRFDAMAEQNGYREASERWNVACERKRRIAKAILRVPAHTPIGEGVRAAAAIAIDEPDLDSAMETTKMVWGLAVRAGFTPPADVARELKRKGKAPAKSKPDPIFAAIERYKVAWAEHGAAIADEPDSDTPEYAVWYAKGDAACNKHVSAVWKFCSTVPTTLAGVAASLRFVEESRKSGDDFLRMFVKKNSHETCHGLFLASLRTATERLAGLAA